MAHTVAAIADLIKLSSPSRRAHVVGLSLGGHVAVQLAADVPEVVESRHRQRRQRVAVP
jgi:pimeloyl-ACP methyl ester carboxylesterase